MAGADFREFLVFRYQLLPTRAEFQSTLFPEVTSVEDLISRKNEIFATVLEQTTDFSIRGVKLIHRELASSDDVFIYRIATSRNLTRETKDFRREKVENWPSILVVFDNKPEIQKLLVERNTKVFQLPRTVPNLLSDRLNHGLQQYQPATRRKRDMRHAKWATDAFNLKLAPFLESIRTEANRLLNYFPGHRMEIVRLGHPGCEYSKASKELIGNRLELEIRYSGLPIPKHEEFLNESRLTALALSMFLAAVKLADSNPADPAALRVLLLDDVLIGVDLSNRVPLLDLLHDEFPNHQIFLFTHDNVWFEIAKARTERLGNWVTNSLHAETAGVGQPEIPRLKGDMKDLAVAERHLDRDKDLRAAAVYVRAAFEARLRKICEKNSVLLPFKNDPHKIGAGLLWDTMIAFHNARKKNEGKRLLDDALIPRINGVRSAVLNRLSHTGPPALTEPDVRAAIATIKDFQAATIPLDA